MSRIDDLIQELCPGGVRFEELSTICSVKTGSAVSKTSIANNPGEYPVINSGKEPLGFISSFNTDEDPIGITSRGAGVGSVTWCSGKYFRGNLNYAVTLKNRDAVSERYFYHVLLFLQPSIQLLCTYQGIPALNKSSLETLRIPVPPIEVQREIVRILDKFTQLEAELEAELEARRKQYEYYRSQLFDFDGQGINYSMKTLGDICLRVSSGGTPRAGLAKYYDGGTIPWLRTNEVRFEAVWDTAVKITPRAVKETSAKWIPANCVVVAISGATAGRSCVNRIPLTTNQHCCNLAIDSDVANYEYVFQWVSANYHQLKSLGHGARADLNSAIIKGFEIPIPDLVEQKRIAQVLDKFDALVNDLSVGLPAELNARRKQYEYYRDKLLTFKELKKDAS